MQIISPAGAPPAFGKLTPSTSSVWLMMHYFTCVNCCFINKLLASREGVCVCVCFLWSSLQRYTVSCALTVAGASQPDRQTLKGLPIGQLLEENLVLGLEDLPPGPAPPSF